MTKGKTTTPRITAEELFRKFRAPDARIEDFGDYFMVAPDDEGSLQPRIVYNPDLVDLGATAEAIQRAQLALPGFNTMVRLMRRGQFEWMLLRGYDGPIIVAEGDSWFTFPHLDVIGALNDRYAISHLGAAGDTLAQMLEQDEYLDETRRVSAQVLLLSGGGNDALGGGDLKAHLRPYDPELTPAQHIKSSFTGLVDEAMRQFDQIFRRVAREAPGVAAICHGYDYALPATGKWLGKPMNAIGITDPAFQRQIVRELIDRFALALGRLAARYPHVVFLDNRGTVGTGDWTDELHPNPGGFRKVAAKFDAAIQEAVARSRTLDAGAAPAVRGRTLKAEGAESPASAPVVRPGLKRPTGMNKGYALHIGLNQVDPGHYGGPQTLYGCHNDAQAMAAIAEEAGYESLGVLLDEHAKVRPVLDAVRKAAAELEPGDIFLLTYAGHGASVPDYSGDEVDDGKDETWCLYDRQLIDDELYEEWAGFKEGVRILVVSDSCHSGSVIRATRDGLVTVDVAAQADSDYRPRSLSDDVRRYVNTTHRSLYRKVAQQLSGDAAEAGGLRPRRARAVTNPLGCTVRLLSACQDNQTAGDGDLNGLFTSRLLQVLERGFRGDYAALHREILSRMPDRQTPSHWVVGRKDPPFDAQQPFEI